MGYTTNTLVRNMIQEHKDREREYDAWLKLNGLMRAPVKRDHAPKKRDKRTDKKLYQIHLIWDLGKETELWVPLGMYSKLDRAYAKVNHLREHHRRERMRLIERGANHLRTPTVYIEFRSTGKARAFNMYPECTFEAFKPNPKSGTEPYKDYFYPKGFVLLGSSKLKKKGKKKKG